MSRPKKDPILPDQVDKSKEKPVIGLRILYPEEKKKLEEKLEKRYGCSISEWVREEARKVLTDSDLRERKEELEEKLKKKEEEREKIKKELSGIEEQLEDREKELEDNLEGLREELIRYNKHKNTVSDASKFAYQITDRIPIKWVDIDQVINILEHWVNESKLPEKAIGPETFADNIIEELREENLVRVGEGSD